jgi:NADPH:quinone reductase-like Zn-dependent oxidoreductase
VKIEISQTMCAALLTGHGGPEKLQLREDVPVPVPGAGEVLIRVAAAAVNNTDINTRIGWYSKSGDATEDGGWAGAPLSLPRIQGADLCGRIVALGEGVDPGRIGERVIVEPCLREARGERLASPWYLGSECDGGFAEYTLVASSHAFAIDSPLSDVELASFPCSYSTAENMLTRAGVKAGERVLVTGASGGVGSAAVQLAKARGAQVVAVTTPDKSAALYELGADQVVDRNAAPRYSLGADTIDVVVDLVGGARWPELLDLLRAGGRYAVSGAIAGAMVALDLRTLYLKDLSFYGCTVLEAGVFANLVKRIEAGQIRPLVAATYPLQRIVDAQAVFQEKRHIGKIVLTVP